MAYLGIIIATLGFIHCVQCHLFAGDHLNKLNFVGHSERDGTSVLRLAYGGVLGLETRLSRGGGEGLSIREVTDGKHLLKLVYSQAGHLLSCDLLQDDPEEMLYFLRQFLSRDTIHKSDLKQKHLIGHLMQQGDFNWDRLTEEDKQAFDMLDIREMTSQCQELHRTVKVKARKEAMEERGDQADASGKGRQKRETDLIFPGTNWCGKGNRSEELGENREVDNCCKRHDLCPIFIKGMDSKYGLTNYGFTTLSHCDCDESFRTCLKYRNDPLADRIGDIFFNRLKMKCFVFEMKEVCVKKSFWGRCTETEMQPQATIQDPLKY